MSTSKKHSDSKSQLRRLMLEKRDETSAEYMQMSARRISKRVFATKEFAVASDIGAYYSAKGEVFTHTMLAGIIKGGRSIYLPRVTGSEMEFGRVQSMEKLVRSDIYDSIMEPPAGAEIPRRMDVILVPAVAASPHTGHRLGHGTGHYDRYITKIRGLQGGRTDNGTESAGEAHAGSISSVTIAALVLEKQLVKRIPSESHDATVDLIITEKRTIRCQ